MSIGFEVDRSVVVRNECIGLTVVARNDSSSIAEAVHVEFVQETKWYAHGHKGRRTRTIASIVVSGAELGERSGSKLGAVREAAGKASQRGLSRGAVADGVQRDLQELLVAGAGVRYELFIPDTCLTTMQTGIIDVRHMLRVRLTTPVFTTSPEVSALLHVPPTSGGSRQATAPSLPPSSSVKVGTCTDTAEAHTERNVRLVSVPQSAVTLEYSSDIPQPSAPPTT